MFSTTIVEGIRLQGAAIEPELISKNSELNSKYDVCFGANKSTMMVISDGRPGPVKSQWEMRILINIFLLFSHKKIV